MVATKRAQTRTPPVLHRRSAGRLLTFAVLWLVVGLCTAWAIGALWFDLPGESIRRAGALLYVACTAVAILCRTSQTWKIGLLTAGFIAVLGWWLTLQPSNDRNWQPDVARTAWAEIAGDQVTLHNVRNCEYRTETDYTARWETRTVDLKQLTGVDVAFNYWGSEWMAHPIASFQFADAPPVCFSIETRKEVGESYSAIGGLFRQFELIYVCADEADVVRLRTNFRRGEDVFLYRTNATPEQARARFLEYVAAMNALHARPRWYNAATTNCTTSIRTQHATTQRMAWDWRILFNGCLDEMLYERGAIAGNLPFPELKRQARINDAAKRASAAGDFSQRIRVGRPGFRASSRHE